MGSARNAPNPLATLNQLTTPATLAPAGTGSGGVGGGVGGGAGSGGG